MRTADRAWLVMVAGIVLYEVTAPRDELLSEGWDRYMKSSRVAATACPFLVAGHLTNVLPIWADPLQWLFLIGKKLRNLTP